MGRTITTKTLVHELDIMVNKKKKCARMSGMTTVDEGNESIARYHKAKTCPPRLMCDIAGLCC